MVNLKNLNLKNLNLNLKKFNITNIKLIVIILIVCILLAFFVVKRNNEMFNNAKSYNYKKDDSQILGKKIRENIFTRTRPELIGNIPKCESCKAP